MTAFCGSEFKLFHALGNHLRVKTRMQLFNLMILGAYHLGAHLIEIICLTHPTSFDIDITQSAHPKKTGNMNFILTNE